VNQKYEPEASTLVVDALFASVGDHVLTDVLGDQVNGVAVVHKILTSSFLDPMKKPEYIEATKRVLIELKVIATQAYRRLIEEVGLPIPNFQPAYAANTPQTNKKITPQGNYGVPGLPSGYPSNDQGLASVMAALQMGGQNPQSGPPQLHIDPGFGQGHARSRGMVNVPPSVYTPAPNDPFNPFAMRTPETGSPNGGMRRNGALTPLPYNHPSPNMSSSGVIGMGQPAYPNMGHPQSHPPPLPQTVPPHVYQAYMYQAYQQNPSNMGSFHA
jgi:protein JSN1